MKRKTVNALLLGMAITLTTPSTTFATANSDDVVNAQQDSEETASGNSDNETPAEPQENPMDENSSITNESNDSTVGNTDTSNEEVQGSNETADAGNEPATTNAQDFTSRLSEVATALNDVSITLVENKETFVADYEKFCKEKASNYTTLKEFLDEYVKTIKKTADKITVLKEFGKVYGNEMNEYTSEYIRTVITNSEADQNLKDVSIGLIDLAENPETLWGVYDDWVAVTPEPENNTSYTGVETENSGSGETGGETSIPEGTPTTPDDTTGSTTPTPEPPANMTAAIDELKALDYSSLSDDMKPQAEQLIADAISKVEACTTAEEITAIVEDTKAKLQQLGEEDVQNIRIEVAISELEQLKASLTFSSDLEKQEAESAFSTYVEMMKKTKTETELSEISTLAKAKLQEISEGTGSVLEKARKKALEDLTAIKNEISDSQTATRVYDLWAEKINLCTTKDEVDKFFTGGKDSLVNLKDAVSTGSTTSYGLFLDCFKMISSNNEDLALLEYVKSNMTSENQVTKISDFLVALEQKDTDSYKKELLSKLETSKNNVSSNQSEKAAEIYNKAVDFMARSSSKKDAYMVYEECQKEFLELNSSNEELDKKIKENIEALEKATTLTSDEAKEIIRIYKEKITAAKTVEEADSLLSEAKEKLKKLEKDDEEAKKLTAAKEEAYKKLDAYLNSVKDPDLKMEVEKVISDAKSDIAIADSVDTINNVLTTVKNKVTELQKKFEEEKKLKTLKEKAISQIDRFLSSVKDADLRAHLSKLVDSAKNDVNNATDAQSVSSILSKFKADAAALTKEYAADKALTAKKTSAIKKITDYTNGKEMTSEMYNLYTKAKEDVMNSKSSSEIDSVYKNFVQEFNKLALASLKEEYSQKLNELLNSAQNSSKYNEIANVISRARDNISRATNESLMENIYSQAKQNVESLMQQNDSEDNLDTIKQNAINELRNATTLTTSTAQKVISVYTNKIQNATSESEVEQALGEGKALLQKLNDAAGIDPDDIEANNANTLTNGSTMNKADGAANGNTTYSSTKKEDLTSGLKGGVKTGDENGFQIIVSLGTLLAALSAIGYLLWKKFKK